MIENNMNEIEKELAERYKWQDKIYQRFEVKIPCLTLAGMTANELERYYNKLEEDEQIEWLGYEDDEDDEEQERIAREARELSYSYRSPAYRPGREYKGVKSREELYKGIINLFREDSVYKENLYRYLKGKVPGVTRKMYKGDLISILMNELNPNNLESVDKALGLKLYLCDLMELFGLSYRKLRKIIEENNIPYGKKKINMEFSGHANTFGLDSICRIYEIIA